MVGFATSIFLYPRWLTTENITVDVMWLKNYPDVHNRQEVEEKSDCLKYSILVLSTTTKWVLFWCQRGLYFCLEWVVLWTAFLLIDNIDFIKLLGLFYVLVFVSPDTYVQALHAPQSIEVVCLFLVRENITNLERTCMLHKGKARSCYTVRHHGLSNFLQSKVVCSLLETTYYNTQFNFYFVSGVIINAT